MDNIFHETRRIVVKIGSALLFDRDNGNLRRGWLTTLCTDVALLRRHQKDVIIVSSGAIALGRGALGLNPRSLKLEESQAAAAVGQVRLAEAYADIFTEHGIIAAQVLLTVGDTEDRRRYLNARATLKALLAFGCVPVINENDTVATAEIRFGDNDRLAARVASMMEADCLALLSDIDGLYTADPARDPGAAHIAEVDRISCEIEAMASETTSGVGRGGMVSKIAAAKTATRAGCETIVASGTIDYPLTSLQFGARCTRFRAKTTSTLARKRWIAGVLKPLGSVTVDDGAVGALLEGKSLLPVGVRQVEGRFDRGDPILVKDICGREVARGLAGYTADDAFSIAGKRSEQIETILGYRGRDEMIHRDDLSLSV